MNFSKTILGPLDRDQNRKHQIALYIQFIVVFFNASAFLSASQYEISTYRVAFGILSDNTATG